MGDHGGGQPQMQEAVKEEDAKWSAKGVHVYYINDFYQKTHDDIDTYNANHRLPVAGHGGMMETAEMMYWEPTPFAYVRPNYKTVPYSGNSDDIDGFLARRAAAASGGARGAGGGGGGGGQRGPTLYPTGNPHFATKEIGKDYAEIGINNTVNQVKKMLAERK